MTAAVPSPVRITCEAVTGQTPAAYGFLPVRCGQSVAIHQWYDSAGNEHRACSRHIRGLESRFRPSDPPEPDWLHLDPVYDTHGDHSDDPSEGHGAASCPTCSGFVDHAPDATAESEWAAWTEGELVAGFGK